MSIYCMYMYVCLCTCLSACLYVCMYVCMYICMYNHIQCHPWPPEYHKSPRLPWSHHKLQGWSMMKTWRVHNTWSWSLDKFGSMFHHIYSFQAVGVLPSQCSGPRSRTFVVECCGGRVLSRVLSGAYAGVNNLRWEVGTLPWYSHRPREKRNTWNSNLLWLWKINLKGASWSVLAAYRQQEDKMAILHNPS